MSADNEASGYFSADYASARDRFRLAASSAGATLDALEIDARDPHGERLTIDLAWIGPPAARRIFVHTSGLHGVEGFPGSAIQLQWLDRGVSALPDGAGVLIAHVLNPYGMAWISRTNEHNVDLNRNFLGPGEAYAGAPGAYRALDPLLNPPGEPSADGFYLRLLARALTLGVRPMRQAIAGGQYAFPEGLFFGGARLEPGPTLLQSYLSQRCVAVERLVAIDVHTGLGRYGEDSLLAQIPAGSPIHAELARVFGVRVQLLEAKGGVAYGVRGSFDLVYARLAPTATVFSLGQEFGVRDPLRTLAALRDDNRRRRAGGLTLDHPIKRRLLDAFSPADDAWRRAVLARGADAIAKGLTLL